MEGIKLPLRGRNRTYGIITWTLKQDFDIKTLVNSAKKVNIEFGDKIYANRTVDYKYRRIAFGKKRMEKIKKDYVTLTMVNGNLVVN